MNLRVSLDGVGYTAKTQYGRLRGQSNRMQHLQKAKGPHWIHRLAEQISSQPQEV